MASLSIGNVPDSLLRDLSTAAARAGRSLDEQAIEALRLGVQFGQRDRAWVDERLAAAKALRDSMPDAWITEDQIRAARDELIR